MDGGQIFVRTRLGEAALNQRDSELGYRQIALLRVTNGEQSVKALRQIFADAEEGLYQLLKEGMVIPRAAMSIRRDPPHRLLMSSLALAALGERAVELYGLIEKIGGDEESLRDGIDRIYRLVRLTMDETAAEELKRQLLKCLL